MPHVNTSIWLDDKFSANAAYTDDKYCCLSLRDAKTGFEEATVWFPVSEVSRVRDIARLLNEIGNPIAGNSPDNARQDAGSPQTLPTSSCRVQT